MRARSISFRVLAQENLPALRGGQPATFIPAGYIAVAMLDLAMTDLRGGVSVAALDALRWMYASHASGLYFSFTWCASVLGCDPNAVRRCLVDECLPAHLRLPSPEDHTGEEWVQRWCEHEGIAELPPAFVVCGVSNADWGYLLGCRLASARLPRAEKLAHRRGISRSSARAMIAALVEWQHSKKRMPSATPKVGDEFGAWTVVSGAALVSPRLRVPCVCVCGRRQFVAVESLRYGRSRSCGCSRRGPRKNKGGVYASA